MLGRRMLLATDRNVRYNDQPGIVLRPLDGESSSIVCDTTSVDDAIFYINAV
jgi:hypothetical protein